MTLFLATAADVPRIEWCAKLCCEEHGQDVVTLDWPYYCAFLMTVLNSGRGFMYLAEDDGLIVGGIAAECGPQPLTGRLRANQLFPSPETCSTSPHRSTGLEFSTTRVHGACGSFCSIQDRKSAV